MRENNNGNGLMSGTGVSGRTIVDSFSEAAKKNPACTAVICGDVFLSYRDLDQQTDQLAKRLIDHGVGCESIVPVFIDNGLYHVLGMIAVMKAGAIYLPIDIQYPTERVKYMLEDAMCTVVLSLQAVRSEIPSGGKYRIICVDDKHEPLNGTSDISANRFFPSPQHGAYIIYTSGSTGKPKGVVVEHAQIYAYMQDVYNRFNLEECGSYGMLGTFSADAGLTAIFAALCFGKSLNIVNVKHFSGFDDLARYFKKFPVDCYKITPSFLEFLMGNNNADEILPKRKLILGGEASSWMLVDKLLKMLPADCKLYNHYGPTETTVGVITYEFSRSEDYSSRLIPLGKPLDHVGVHVLDENMIVVPEGGTGELYIDGPLVARGYLNNPELTHQRFIIHEANGLMKRRYKTGDLVRISTEGHIEYLGRIDDQVKIRGHRIELEEIQNVVLQTGKVKECTVVVREHSSGSKYLACYMIASENFEKEALINYVKKVLPGYMIPNRWITVTAWPRTFNNKIDKRALPDPEQYDLPVAADSGIAQEDGLTRKLASIWKKVLNTDSVGIHDNFLELGGDSLLLIRLSFEIHEQLNINAPSAELFGYLTLESMTSYLSKEKVTELPVHKSNDDFAATEVSAAQKAMFMRHKLNPSEAFPNTSLTYEINGRVDIAKVEQAFAAILNTHESLKSSYFFSAGKVHKRIQAISDFRVQYLRTQSLDIDSEINAATKPFDFSTAPLIRVFLIEQENSRKYLHIDMPHINSDGESIKIIIQDFVALMNGVAVTNNRVQYTDYQRRVHKYVSSHQYMVDKMFWEGEISKEVPALKFNVAAGFSKKSKGNGVCMAKRFPDDLGERIKDIVKSRHFTRFQILLAAYFLLLHKLTASSRISLMVPVHNRNERADADIVGLLTNIVLVSVNIRNDQSISEFMADCKQAVLKAVTHQRFPFNELISLYVKRWGNATNLFGSFFGYHYNKAEYVFSETRLKLYIPASHNESLPLSMAVFETESYITLRLSSTSGTFGQSELENLLGQTMHIISIMMEHPERLVTSLLNDQHLTGKEM